MKEDFILLKRLEARLGSAVQWLQKTPEGDPRGGWSRWRKNPDRRNAGFEILKVEPISIARNTPVRP